MDTVSGSHSCYNGRITFTYVDGTFGRGLRADVMDQHTWLMLSDQCPWHFRIESSVDGIIKVTRGSMIKQIDDCLRTLDRMNPRMCNDRQPGRFRRFPKAALEETVLNAVIHRDYDIQDDTVITLHPDSLDFESPGTLWFPDRWNIRIWSEPRNLEIANILMRLD